MATRFWHRFVIMTAPAVWSVFRKMPWLRALIVHLIPEIRFVGRPGRLRGGDKTRKYLETKLLPFDIIIDRGPPKLSDPLIPGYFKHAAIFLGCELAQEIMRTAEANGAPSPLRGHPPVILEATRHGVSLVSLDEFLNADSVVVLRPHNVSLVSLEDKNRIVCRAARELGKEYDYAFNLASKQKQFCCKLVYALFPDLPIADVFKAGTAMVPDDFVQPALSQPSSAPKIVLLICDGQRIQANHQEAVLEQLLRDGRRRTTTGIRSLFRRSPGGDLESGVPLS
jgi:hypothetical protein